MIERTGSQGTSNGTALMNSVTPAFFFMSVFMAMAPMMLGLILVFAKPDSASGQQVVPPPSKVESAPLAPPPISAAPSAPAIVPPPPALTTPSASPAPTMPVSPSIAAPVPVTPVPTIPVPVSPAPVNPVPASPAPVTADPAAPASTLPDAPPATLPTLPSPAITLPQGTASSPPAVISPAPPTATLPVSPGVISPAPPVAIQPDASAEPSIVELTIEPRAVLALKDDASNEDGFSVLIKDIARVTEEARKAGIIVTGRPFAVIDLTDEKRFRFEVMLPVVKPPDGKPPAGLNFGLSPAGQAIRFRYSGAYEESSYVYESIEAYLEEKDIKAKGFAIEEYLSDPRDSNDATLQMYIYYLKE